MALRGYRFEHPHKENEVVTIGGWSYLWAGLLGCFYVAAWGSRRHVFKALLINLGYLAVFCVVVAGSFLVAPVYQLAVILVSTPTLVLLQGAAMIRLVRDAYRRRGWWVQRA